MFFQKSRNLSRSLLTKAISTVEGGTKCICALKLKIAIAFSVLRTQNKPETSEFPDVFSFTKIYGFCELLEKLLRAFV